jgi:F-type H+-transporting ATPase subunit h
VRKTRDAGRQQSPPRHGVTLGCLRRRLIVGVLEKRPAQHHHEATHRQLPPRLHQHHACAIHQGLGTTLTPHLRSCSLTLHSARPSLASPGSKLPPSPAAPSSPPRPFAQVIHPNRATRDCTDPIGAPADLVQDLYLRELKAYKVPQVKASDAEGSVQKFTVPPTPTSPEESDIASELKSYETQSVDVEGAVGEDGAVAPEEDWFAEEDETTAPAAH